MDSKDEMKARAASRSRRVRARAPLISLDQPGRLRVSHLLALFGVSHTYFYAGLKTKRYPPPDGKDGRVTFWKTSTIKRFLET